MATVRRPPENQSYTVVDFSAQRPDPRHACTRPATNPDKSSSRAKPHSFTAGRT